MITRWGIGKAIDHLRDGLRVQRGAWGPTTWIELRKPLPMDDLVLPVIVLRTSVGRKTVWTPTHGDILAKDWRPAGV